MRSNLPVTQNEILLSETTMIVSKTNLKGQITYINHDFLAISGFIEAELIGQPHNIVRHPDMPVEAFAGRPHEQDRARRRLGSNCHQRIWQGTRMKSGQSFELDAQVYPARCALNAIIGRRGRPLPPDGLLGKQTSDQRA